MFSVNWLSLVWELLLSIGTRDILDVLIVAFVIYLALIFIRQTRSYFVLTALALLLIVNLTTQTLNLGLTRQLFQPLVTFFLVIFVVIFQREIRRFLEWFTVKGRNLARERTRLLSRNAANAIVEAVFELAKNKRGAIIVFPREYPLDNLLDGGFALDGKISSALLLSIFDPSSPGHDGAVIIDDNRIKRFGAHLPLAENFADFAKVGTRHRAGAGITEKSDALALVVSEERGTISKSENGVLTLLPDREAVEAVVHQFFTSELVDLSPASPWQYLVVRNWSTKLISVILAALLWFVFIYQTGTVTKEYLVPLEARFVAKELTLSEINPKEISVTLSGNYQDLQNLDARSLKVFVDLREAGVGYRDIRLTDENVSHPSYLSLVSVSPRYISLQLASTSKLQIINE